jgi:hypothetical protein
MPPLTYERLLELARAAEGRTLETVTGKQFRVGIYRDCPFFTPLSSGYGQSDGRKAAERFVERHNEIGSLRPGDYADVTRNASYYLALLKHD